MTTTPAAARLLEGEARALVTRLSRVRPFALHETMVPAASLSPAAQSAIERFLIGGRRALRRRVLDYIDWLRGEGATASPAEQQRRFTLLRMSFNDVLSQFDLFTEVITQRSEHENGVWLSGLDALAADALSLPRHTLEAPPAICYLARGPGAAIRRARTRLPGGVLNPVAIIRIPRERMIGHGIGSSLIHEVGHQGAALLQLVESLRPAIRAHAQTVDPDTAKAWKCWERWISEIVADVWSVSKLGIGSTLGLMGVVSLPRWFVFRPSGDDPHPIPWIRVRLSAAIGNALYPHPQWAELSRTWAALYPIEGLPEALARTIRRLDAAIPAFVGMMLSHRPPALGGATLRDAMHMPERTPEQLVAQFQAWQRSSGLVYTAPPTLVFAAVGQARSAGLTSPEAESRLLSRLLTTWALRSSLDVSQICAERSVALAGRRAS